jgi:hypothetical protein
MRSGVGRVPSGSKGMNMTSKTKGRRIAPSPPQLSVSDPPDREAADEELRLVVLRHLKMSFHECEEEIREAGAGLIATPGRALDFFNDTVKAVARAEVWAEVIKSLESKQGVTITIIDRYAREKVERLAKFGAPSSTGWLAIPLAFEKLAAWQWVVECIDHARKGILYFSAGAKGQAFR